MRIFKANEILKFAIRIEENGEKFYKTAADKFDDRGLKDTLTFLAGEEVKHKKTFKGILSDVTEDTKFENYPEEYMDYLKCYVDDVIFTDKELDEKLKTVDSPLDAIDFGIKIELDSILFYHEMKEFVPSKHHGKVDAIIEEERKHYNKLNSIKENYK